MLAHAPGDLFDQDAAPRAIDPPQAINQKDQIAPESDELKPARCARLIVAGRGLMTARTNRRGSFPRPDRDEDGLLVLVATGLPVNKSRDGTTLIQNSGKPHGVDRKMKTNPNSSLSTPAALLPYCRDLPEWPERWMGEEKDLPSGRKLVECLTPFPLELAVSGLSKRTIQRHGDNIRIHGGEIIRDLNEESPPRQVAAERLIAMAISQHGGPPIHNGWEDEQRSFDFTCRKFHRFLTQAKR